MKFILVFVYLIVPIFSLKGHKICINCKYFKKDFLSNDNFGKCALFPKEIYNTDYLVDGKRIKQKNEYYYCSTARSSDDMCGKSGKQFVKKNS